MQQVRFGIVGYGRIGSKHAALVATEPGAILNAICDDNADRLRLAATRHPDVAVFGSLEELLAKSAAEVICVCTPHFLHAQMAILAAAAGKHVLVEKPMALNTQDADEMIRAATASRVSLMVVKQNRYNVPVAMTTEALERGRLGRLLMVHCSVIWNRDEAYYRTSPWLGKRRFEGGALFTQVSHFLDLLVWWFGDIRDADVVVATELHDIEVEDCGTARVSFERGVQGTLFWTTCSFEGNCEGSITIVAERGTIKIGGRYLNRLDYWRVDGEPVPAGIQFTDTPNDYGGFTGSSSNHDKVIQDVIRHLRGDAPFPVDGWEGRKAIAAIEKLYSAARVSRRELEAT